jgi:hypothetical protein
MDMRPIHMQPVVSAIPLRRLQPAREEDAQRFIAFDSRVLKSIVLIDQ